MNRTKRTQKNRINNKRSSAKEIMINEANSKMTATSTNYGKEKYNEIHTNWSISEKKIRIKLTQP